MLSKTVEVGDPVTPLTSFQEGTVLMKMANMERLLFKGTVDEIDVGKLKEGMPVEIKVGRPAERHGEGGGEEDFAEGGKEGERHGLPDRDPDPQGVQQRTLRAGYSANANIIIQRKDSVLTHPGARR